ncbi:hypothetical protein J6590_063714 [Homalodisca vitripennis]|nr:hypothetical protein J6590_063714 [Homalodisca vitripennis]
MTGFRHTGVLVRTRVASEDRSDYLLYLLLYNLPGPRDTSLSPSSLVTYYTTNGGGREEIGSQVFGYQNLTFAMFSSRMEDMENRIVSIPLTKSRRRRLVVRGSRASRRWVHADRSTHSFTIPYRVIDSSCRKYGEECTQNPLAAARLSRREVTESCDSRIARAYCVCARYHYKYSGSQPYQSPA